MRILPYILKFQGGYYLATALWAIVDHESFMRATNHYAEPFMLYSFAGLIFVIALFLVTASRQENLIRPAARLGLGTALAIAIVEATFFPHMGVSALFWLDLWAELALVILLGVALFSKRKVG